MGHQQYYTKKTHMGNNETPERGSVWKQVSTRTPRAPETLKELMTSISLMEADNEEDYERAKKYLIEVGEGTLQAQNAYKAIQQKFPALYKPEDFPFMENPPAGLRDLFPDRETITNAVRTIKTGFKEAFKNFGMNNKR